MIRPGDVVEELHAGGLRFLVLNSRYTADGVVHQLWSLDPLYHDEEASDQELQLNYRKIICK